MFDSDGSQLAPSVGAVGSWVIVEVSRVGSVGRSSAPCICLGQDRAEPGKRFERAEFVARAADLGCKSRVSAAEFSFVCTTEVVGREEEAEEEGADWK